MIFVQAAEFDWLPNGTKAMYSKTFSKTIRRMKLTFCIHVNDIIPFLVKKPTFLHTIYLKNLMTYVGYNGRNQIYHGLCTCTCDYALVDTRAQPWYI